MITETLPVEPESTIAIILESLNALNQAAGVPPKATVVVPLKCAPTINILSPLCALVGVKKEITGAVVSCAVESLINVNPDFDAVPCKVVTETFPLAPAPTFANITVSDRTLIELAATPPNLTAVVPLKCNPKIVTVVPLRALEGVKRVSC